MLQDTISTVFDSIFVKKKAEMDTCSKYDFVEDWLCKTQSRFVQAEDTQKTGYEDLVIKTHLNQNHSVDETICIDDYVYPEKDFIRHYQAWKKQDHALQK